MRTDANLRRRPVRPARRGRRPAMVLIIVVVVMVMLSLAGLGFVATMQTENKAARVQGRRLQLEQVVDSGAEMLKSYGEQPWSDRQESGGPWDNPEQFRGVLVVEDESARRRARFSIVSPRNEDSATTGLRFGVENESAKLNLAVLPRWDQREPGAARRALMNLPEMTSSTADAILDWIDSDSMPRQSGAEADYYRELEVPYGPRNGVPQCLEELLLIRGVTRELLFGADDALAGSASSRPRSRIPWVSLVTVSSAERNETLDGRPRIDLNSPDLRQLHQRLSTALDGTWADFIVRYRQYGPYQGRREASEAPPAVDLSAPATYRIQSLLELVGAKVRLPGARRTAPVVVSPLSGESQLLAPGLTRLLDLAAVDPAPIVEGKINVNLAPREVLMAVPGMDPALVDRIVVARGTSGSREDAQRHFPTWLLTDGLVDLPTMKSLLPYLTGGGDVVRAEIIGYYDEAGPALRVEAVIDAACTPPRQVYRKALHLPGDARMRELLGGDRGDSPSRPFASKARR